MIIRLIFSFIFALNLLALSSGRLSRAFIGVIASFLTAAVLAGVACLFYGVPKNLLKGGQCPQGVWQSVLGFSVLMLIVALHNSIALASGGYPSPGLIGQEMMGMPQIFAFYIAGVAAWQKLGEEGVSELMHASITGFVIWGGINIILMKSGYGNVSSESAIAIYGGIEGRRAWAPFAPAGNHFGVLLAINSVCALSFYVYAGKRFSADGMVKLAVALCAMFVSLYGSFLIENRSSLLVWFFGLALLAFAWIRSFRFIPVLVVFAWVVAPFLILYVFSSLKLLEFLPRSLDVFFMRGDTDLTTFGMRTPIYEYGFSLIAGGYVPVWGMGMLKTDASSVFTEYFVVKDVVLVGFHCVILQYFIQFGPIFTAVALVVFAWIPLHLTRQVNLGKQFALPLFLLTIYYFSHTLDIELKHFEMYGPFILVLLLFARQGNHPKHALGAKRPRRKMSVHFL